MTQEWEPDINDHYHNNIVTTNDEAWLAIKFPKDIWKEPGTTFQVQFQYFSSVLYSKPVAKQSNIIVQHKLLPQG